MPSGRFYCPNLALGPVPLPAEEARHAVRVLRMRVGDRAELFDGAGRVAEGVIERISRQSVGLRVDAVQTIAFELRHHLTLAVAMSKSHRQSYLIEKCTELGAGEIWPIRAGRSVTRPGEAAVEKWSRRAIEAAKQSGRAWVPIVGAAIPFAEAVARCADFDLAVLADPDPQATLLPKLLDSATPMKLLALVGPEGGWTLEERALARQAGVRPVRLSPTILRSETAAVAVCAAVAAQG